MIENLAQQPVGGEADSMSGPQLLDDVLWVDHPVWWNPIPSIDPASLLLTKRAPAKDTLAEGPACRYPECQVGRLWS